MTAFGAKRTLGGSGRMSATQSGHSLTLAMLTASDHKRLVYRARQLNSADYRTIAGNFLHSPANSRQLGKFSGKNEVWPIKALATLADGGHRLAPLANGSPPIIGPALP